MNIAKLQTHIQNLEYVQCFTLYILQKNKHGTNHKQAEQKGTQREPPIRLENKTLIKTIAYQKV